jgi:hypothetical protein
MVLGTPNRHSLAREVAQLADAIVDIPVNDAQAMLPLRPAATGSFRATP